MCTGAVCWRWGSEPWAPATLVSAACLQQAHNCQLGLLLQRCQCSSRDGAGCSRCCQHGARIERAAPQRVAEQPRTQNGDASAAPDRSHAGSARPAALRSTVCLPSRSLAEFRLPAAWPCSTHAACGGWSCSLGVLAQGLASCCCCGGVGARRPHATPPPGAQHGSAAVLRCRGARREQRAPQRGPQVRRAGTVLVGPPGALCAAAPAAPRPVPLHPPGRVRHARARRRRVSRALLGPQGAGRGLRGRHPLGEHGAPGRRRARHRRGARGRAGGQGARAAGPARGQPRQVCVLVLEGRGGAHGGCGVRWISCCKRACRYDCVPLEELVAAPHTPTPQQGADPAASGSGNPSSSGASGHQRGWGRAGAYDVVLASEVVEHVRRPDAFLRSLAAALRPDGTLVVSTLNRTPAAWGAAIMGAEYVAGLVPRCGLQSDSFGRGGTTAGSRVT